MSATFSSSRVVDAKELVRRFLRLYNPAAAELFDNVRVMEVEVPNAPLYAEYGGLDAKGFCTTVNTPCDVQANELLLDLLASLTGWDPGYYRHACSRDRGFDKGCFILALENPGSVDEELYARTVAALRGHRYAVIFTENNPNWDVFVTARDEEDSVYKRAMKIADIVEAMDEIAERVCSRYGDESKACELVNDIRYEHPEMAEKLVGEAANAPVDAVVRKVEELMKRSGA